MLGILIGPDVLDIAHVTSTLSFLANFGLVFLFFFAGLEVIEQRVPRTAVMRGTAGWVVSATLGAIAENSTIVSVRPM